MWIITLLAIILFSLLGAITYVSFCHRRKMYLPFVVLGIVFGYFSYSSGIFFPLRYGIIILGVICLLILMFWVSYSGVSFHDTLLFFSKKQIYLFFSMFVFLLLLFYIFLSHWYFFASLILSFVLCSYNLYITYGHENKKHFLVLLFGFLIPVLFIEFHQASFSQIGFEALSLHLPDIFVVFFLGLFIGFFMAFFCVKCIRYFHKGAWMWSFIFLFLSFFCAQFFGGSGILSVFIFSVVLGKLQLIEHEHIVDFYLPLQKFCSYMLAFIFGFVGFELMHSFSWFFVFVLAGLIIILFSLLVSVFFDAWKHLFNDHQGVLLGIVLFGSSFYGLSSMINLSILLLFYIGVVHLFFHEVIFDLP